MKYMTYTVTYMEDKGHYGETFLSLTDAMLFKAALTDSVYPMLHTNIEKMEVMS